MKPYNIAVCLSGEPRTWQHTANAIKHFFSSDVHNYKFFGHTWNNSYYNKEHRYARNSLINSFKSSNSAIQDHSVNTVKNYNSQFEHSWKDDYDNKTLADNLIDTFGMTDILVEDKKVVSDICSSLDLIYPEYVAKFDKETSANQRKPVVWSHMSYSKMRANSLKTRYELENEMQFDVVVSARFDTCYYPDAKFDHWLQPYGTILPTAIYGETHYFPNEYFLPHINDVIYFGNSRIMNVVDDFYRYFVSGKFWEMLDENYTDCALKSCGYNVNLYKWLTIKNILIKNINIPYIVFRKTATNLTWPQDWNEIVNANRILFQ